MAKTTQVRTYTVREGLLDEWAQRWKAEILPLRLEWGFAIGGAWVDREHNQFLWLITYEGPETFAERNAMYADSPPASRWTSIRTTTSSPSRSGRWRSGTEPTRRLRPRAWASSRS